MNAKVDVVGIGSCTVDYFAIVPRLLGPEEKINATRMEIHAGGVTANNLTQVARLGASTGWLGLIGDDENGRAIQKAFTDDGMDLSGIEVVKGEHSSLTWIPVDVPGERCIYMFPNVTGKIIRASGAARASRHTFGGPSISTRRLAASHRAGKASDARGARSQRASHFRSGRRAQFFRADESWHAGGTLQRAAAGRRPEAVQSGCARNDRRIRLRKNCEDLLGSGPNDRRHHAGRGRLPDREPREDPHVPAFK